MNSFLKLAIAAIVVIALPNQADASKPPTKQYVYCYDEPELVEVGHGNYEIIQGCSAGWLYSDGTFEEDYWDPDAGFWDLHGDYGNEWDYANWRADKCVIEADEGESFPGFKTNSWYWFEDCYHACIEAVGHASNDYWSIYYDYAYLYYDYYNSIGYYYYAIACYYYYYCLGDYYYYTDCGDYQRAMRSFYQGLSLYYYFYYAQYSLYEYSYSYYYYYYSYSETYTETTTDSEEDWW